MSDESLNSSFSRKEEIIKDTGALKVAWGEGEKDCVKYVIDEDNCIGCTKCARTCPVKAISGKAKKVHVIAPDICIGCGQCVEACPKESIHVKD